MAVFRVYVEKKAPYALKAEELKKEIQSFLELPQLKELRILNRYDVEGIDEELFGRAIDKIFSNAVTDDVYFEEPESFMAIRSEYLPGQFDQRAESCSECIQLISMKERPICRSATIYLLEGALAETDRKKIKNYLINPVESREAAKELPESLKAEFPEPESVPIIEGFIGMDDSELGKLLESMGFAMDLDDLRFSQNYFKSEQRDPTETELRVLDTYWSDHCRHSTFNTEITKISIDDEDSSKAYERYLEIRRELGRENKPISLMDLATIGAKYLKHKGVLKNLDESEEVNACSVKIRADVNGEYEDWLLMFKNETHNHPTEIEPFGGASTCLGGAIRDPLSGRAYCYQAMRVTGAADPRTPLSKTLKGKLPQYKIVTEAAEGYSSYGNQIGLTTGLVDEIYHPGYVAKRMEVGAIMAAAPAINVVRKRPQAGDLIILLGGRTGRDGIGGASGSSKAHDLESLTSCGAEVQKGNAPEERKIQRLFRKGEVSRMIIRCNDFGAGGVSVAVGELADGLRIELDKVPLKYEGLSGTELAISESQERMAVCLHAEDSERFIEEAKKENLEATVIAEVTEEPVLRMYFRNELICDLKRSFLDTNGASKQSEVHVETLKEPVSEDYENDTFSALFEKKLSDLNSCSKKGLVSRFDSSIGKASVLVPLGGKKQSSPADCMIAKLPVFGETHTCSGMAYGFDPYLSEQNTYLGAYTAVAMSIAKLVAAGFRRDNIYLSFQEYFERLGNEPSRWGKPFSALLGALSAQLDLSVASIGGKDSMSGSFEDLDVPPTLISFAVSHGDVKNIISPEFKRAGSKVYLLKAPVCDKESLVACLDRLEKLISESLIISALTVSNSPAESVFKAGVGNSIGFIFSEKFSQTELFNKNYISFVLEVEDELIEDESLRFLGETRKEFLFEHKSEKADGKKLEKAWENTLSSVYPTEVEGKTVKKQAPFRHAEKPRFPKIGIARPAAVIPIFPGTNCEYDTAEALRRAGGVPIFSHVRNLSPEMISGSVKELKKALDSAQMLIIPGGFSGGDEPDGSGKFINSFFRNPELSDAVHALLERDGLILGICNGFQALLRLGLLPFGKICSITADSATLSFNEIGRHQSGLFKTIVSSKLSPWLSKTELGEVFTIPVSHGEGRFCCSSELLNTLIENGQIAAQYVDDEGLVSSDIRHCPNGSVFGIEAISSPDGRILGKMGHSERSGENLYINVSGNKYQPLFEGGVDYFRL